jgi:hypothetical protein
MAEDDNNIYTKSAASEAKDLSGYEPVKKGERSMKRIGGKESVR